MTILSMPAAPAFSASTFGLVSQTQTFFSPLSGQTQTLERPGARWRADYRLPPMKRAQAAQWQAFLLQLRGGAGRFYGFDPDAQSTRGSGAALAVSSRNEIRNGQGTGALAGVIGAGGASPTNWIFGPANGLTREITAIGEEAGIRYIELRISGTPTVNYSSLAFENNTQIVVMEGEVWTSSFYYRLAGGSLTNVAAVQQRLEQNQDNGTLTVNAYQSVGTVDATWRRASFTRTISDTTPDTARVRPALYLNLTVGLPVDLTLRLGQAQFEKASAASVYIPTTGSARSRDAGARVDGSSQSGAVLATWNWQPSATALLKAGDYVAFETGSGRALHQVVADAGSDAGGRALLQIEPPLRTPPADNTALILIQPSCVMALLEDSVSWQTDAQGIYRLAFAAEERF